MTRTLDVGRTSGKGKSSHDTRCIPPSKAACGRGARRRGIAQDPHPQCRSSFFLAMPRPCLLTASPLGWPK